MLGVYDDYSRQLEQEHEEESRRHRIDTIRRARKAREEFKALLHELKYREELNRLSKWKETLPKIRDDERYYALLGLRGSSPLDLWMDAVDDMGEELERAAEKIERALAKEEKGIKLETTWEEYEGLVRDVHMDSQIDVKLRKEVFDMVGKRSSWCEVLMMQVHGRLAQIAADESRRAERKRRHRIDDLRYALKKVQRHIDLDMTYEEVGLVLLYTCSVHVYLGHSSHARTRRVQGHRLRSGPPNRVREIRPTTKGASSSAHRMDWMLIMMYRRSFVKRSPVKWGQHDRTRSGTKGLTGVERR